MRILITGGSGFIGTNLIDYYISKGDVVQNIDIKPPQNEAHISYWIRTDIRDIAELRIRVMAFKPDFVINMAAKADLTGKSIDDYSTNTFGVKALLEVCNEVKSIRKVLFTSTMLVCKAGYLPKDENDYCPPNLYGESKMIGEKIVREAADILKYDWLIIRPTSIWGPWFGPTYRGFFEMIIQHRYFNFSGKMSNKTYGYVGNTVYQIDSLLQADSSNRKTYYIGDYDPTNIREWATEIANEVNSSLLTIPRQIIWLAAKIGDILQYFHFKFPINSFRFKNMTTDNILPLQETQKIAPLTVYSRIEANKLTIKWMREFYFKK